MLKKEVLICDLCKTRIAEHKCLQCGRDLCPNCAYGIEIFTGEYPYLMKIVYGTDKPSEIRICRECLDTIIKGIRKLDESAVEELLKNFLSEIFGTIIADKL